MRAVLFVTMVGLAACCRPSIMHPELPIDKGTYDAPAGKTGQAPAQPWSATTINSGVDKKPLNGRIATVVGEVVDLSCYLQLGKHGAKHRDCAQKCMRNGQPIGLLAKDGTVYILMEEEHDPRRDGQTNLREHLIENAAAIIEVTGTVATVGWYKGLYVTGFIKK